MPDGRIGRFEVPDGTTPEQAQSMIASQLPSLADKPKTQATADGASAYDAPKTYDSINAGKAPVGEVLQNIGNIAAGLVRGAGSIGSTLLAPYDMAKDALAGKGLSLESNRQRRAAIDEGLQSMGADPSSINYKAGKLGGEIAGTAGVGGLIGNAVSAGAKAISPAAAAAANPLVNALASGGFKAGVTPGVTNMLTRMAGGAGAGGAAAGLINPDDAAGGAAIGAALPPALSAVGKTLGYVGRAAGSAVKPFTTSGQNEIAGDIVNKFAKGGPVFVDSSQVVPGSVPTLAEATGNAGLATLQRGLRDVRPNAFIEREANNAAARSKLLDSIAGDQSQLDFYRTDRSTVGKQLYDTALDQSAQQPLTPYLKGQITQLLKRPSITDATKTAERWALERGEQPSGEGSLRALHDVKTAIDDKIADSVRNNQGGEVAALQATKDKLLNVMEKLSPDYAEARATYSAMSKPINAMEALQGLKLTDARGNITLSRVKNAIDGLEKQINAPGINAAKDITSEQLGALKAIKSDLLRADNTSLGKSIGSNTFQNIATDNMLASLLPGPIGDFAQGKVGGVLGQAGKLLYSGPNEAIRNRLVDMALNPQLAEPALSSSIFGKPAVPQNILMRLVNNPSLRSTIYRAAPAIATSQ
jgi:hypothetical protein